VKQVNALNDTSDSYTAYKLLFLARHGEGVHNLAEALYGTPAWNSYWSHLNGDGNLVWGPDPKLTLKGEMQASAANLAWKQEMKDAVPIPQSFYSSPLQRASNTLEITWKDIQLSRGILPLIVEDLRET
jgi:broad specificity phosphatase PhoE